MSRSSDNNSAVAASSTLAAFSLPAEDARSGTQTIALPFQRIGQGLQNPTGDLGQAVRSPCWPTRKARRARPHCWFQAARHLLQSLTHLFAGARAAVFQVIAQRTPAPPSVSARLFGGLFQGVDKLLFQIAELFQAGLEFLVLEGFSLATASRKVYEAACACATDGLIQPGHRLLEALLHFAAACGQATAHPRTDRANDRPAYSFSAMRRSCSARAVNSRTRSCRSGVVTAASASSCHCASWVLLRIQHSSGVDVRTHS